VSRVLAAGLGGTYILLIAVVAFIPPMVCSHHPDLVT
jgi:hypothetical protein